MHGPVRTLLVHGGGLAGAFTAMSLAKTLGEGLRIIYARQDDAAALDFFYGHATAPSAYEFLRTLGLDEPSLFTRTASSFSLGAHFKTWLAGRSWVQCHHLPLPLPGGVPLIHHLTRSQAPVEPVLVSAQAALRGGFAHPPGDAANPWSRAEYGYQFSPSEWADHLERLLPETQIELVSSPVRRLSTDKQRITQVEFESGDIIAPDLVIDCSGPLRTCIQAVGGAFQVTHDVSARLDMTRCQQLGPPCRIIEASQTGWSARAHLRDREIVLFVTDPESSSGPDARKIGLGQIDAAWVGNCVAIGHASFITEPLSPAPMMMLQADIERLLDLIPLGEDMSVERQEFNRRFLENVSHTQMFQGAILTSPDHPQTPYWQHAQTRSAVKGLERKVRQFENRGILVKYDLEPFNDEDWLIAHLGMGRRPKSYDRQVEAISAEQSVAVCRDLASTVAKLVPRLPPHHLYVTNLVRYLKKQQHA
jgi:tryptophan halogenase